MVPPPLSANGIVVVVIVDVDVGVSVSVGVVGGSGNRGAEFAAATATAAAVAAGFRWLETRGGPGRRRSCIEGVPMELRARSSGMMGFWTLFDASDLGRGCDWFGSAMMVVEGDAHVHS